MDVDLTPLLAAPWHIQVHAMSALAALLIGAVQFAAPKGTLPHKAIGTLWLGLMAVVAVSSAFIVGPPSEDGGVLGRVSFIHVFTVVTALGIIDGLRYLFGRKARVKRHWKPFLGIYIGGLVIAGAFAFSPGRIMHEVVFGG